MPDDDEYKNSSENKNRSEEPQSDLNDKGFEQYVNEDGSKDAIRNEDYFQDSESIPQKNFVAKPKSQDSNKNVNSDTHSASDQIKDTSGEQISNTNDYYHFGRDDHSEDTSGFNENVSESEQDYSSNEESSSQISSQISSTDSTSGSKNVSQQSSEKSSNKSHINEQNSSTSVLNSTEQESSSSSSIKSESASSSPIKPEGKSNTPLKSEGESNTPLKPEGESNTPIKPEGKSNTPIKPEGKSNTPLKPEGKSNTPLKPEGKSNTPLKPEGESNTPIKPEGKSNTPLKPEGESNTPLKSGNASSSQIKSKNAGSDSVLKDQETSSQVLRKSASTGDLKRNKNSILQNKDKNKDKDKKDKDKKDKDSKKNDTSMAKTLNVASSISNVLKVNDEQNAAENIVNNALKELKSKGVRMAKSKLKDLLLKKCLAEGIEKSVAKKAIKKVLNSTKVGAIATAPGQILNTIGNLYSGNIGDTFKDAAVSLANGDPVPLIITAVVIGMVVLFGLSLVGSPFSEDSKVNSTNYVENIEEDKSSAFEFKDEESDEDEENRFNATAMINFNNKFNNLNDYFYKYSDDSNNMLSNSLKKSDQSINLMKQLAKKLVQTRQFKYSIFDDYFIKYFFDEVTENELKNKVKSDIKNSGMLFTETYIGKAIETNKPYNSFKKDLDDYKDKINQIKANTEKAEGEDENAFRNKVINEFKTQNPNADFIYLTCYKLFSDSVDNLKIVKNIDMNLENRWENTRELTSLIYFIKNINDVDENRDLNIENSDLENILKSLEDEMTDLNVSIVGKDTSGNDLDFNYIYGSKRKKASLYLEKEFLSTCDVKYQKIINDIGVREDISGVDFSNYENIMVNTENWSLIYNLQILERLINNYSSAYIPNDLLLGNMQSNTNNQDDESEKETYDFDNCLYKVYSTIQMKTAENFGQTEYNGTEPYERINGNIFYGIPEIDVTEIDKAFYFNTELVMNTAVTPNKSFSAIKRDEIVQKLEDLIQLLVNYQNIVKDVKQKNKDELSDLVNRISNENTDIIAKGDGDSKYIYEDSKIDDLFAFDDLSTIEIDKEKYYVFNNISELSAIKLDLSSKEFLTWLENDSSFYDDYIPEALIFEKEDELGDMLDIDSFAKVLGNADENFVEEVFKDADQQYEKLLSDSDYDLTEEYIAFKYLLFGGVQNLEPVLNQIWEENISDIFGSFVTEKTNSTNDDLPFSNDYNDYIALNMPVGKEIYAICSGKVVEKTDNSITIKNSEQLFAEGYSFYVEYKNLSPNVNVGDEVFRYSVPTENYVEEDGNGNIKDSTVIGKAKAEALQIKCYHQFNENLYYIPEKDIDILKDIPNDVIEKIRKDMDEGIYNKYHKEISSYLPEDIMRRIKERYPFNYEQFLNKLENLFKNGFRGFYYMINPRLIIQDDDGLPIEPYVVPPSPTAELYPAPSYKMHTLPPKVEMPTITPDLTPSDPSYKKLLFVFGTIIYYAGSLYAIWAIIKFALGLHDYESANYQSIWQFIAASVLIFAALLLKYLSGL